MIEHDGHVVVAEFCEFGIKLIRHHGSPAGTWDHLVFEETPLFYYRQREPDGIDVVDRATNKVVMCLVPPLVADALAEIVNPDADHQGAIAAPSGTPPS